VYDALTSRRSYRPGWTAERATQYILSLAGTQFNRQAVEHFAAAVTPYPLCSDVRIGNGRYAGYVGIVSAVDKSDMQHPKVRILFNPYGQRVDPIEIDLAIDRDITISAMSISELKQLPKQVA